MNRKLKEAEYKLKSEIRALFFPEQCTEAENNADKKKIFVFLGGYYQNLGDLAITVAQIRFLKKHFPSYTVIAVPSNRTYRYMKSVKKSLTAEDIITVVGGGNMSDKYVSLEHARRFVVRNFRKNPVISFPQTFDFSDTHYGKVIKKESVGVYNSCKNFCCFAREKNSFLQMKNCLSGTVGLCPDIVLSMDKTAKNTQRDGVLCCFRNDAELSVSGELKAAIIKKLSEKFSVEQRDTVDVPLEDCMPENAEKTLDAFFDLLKSKQLVVTDRLHCMLFCVITKTPCIAFDNANGKISGTVDCWLKDCGYINFFDGNDIDGFMKAAEKMLLINPDSLKKPELSEKYLPLVDAIGAFA